MRCYAEIRRTPLCDLTIAENGLLQLEYAMLKVRERANEVHQRRWMDSRDMVYDVGFFNGVRFTMLDQLRDFYWRDYLEFSEIADRYKSEVDFLSGEYLNRKAT